MARKDRHTLLMVGAMWLCVFRMNARKGIETRGHGKGWLISWGAKCDQYFSSTLVGGDRGLTGESRISGFFGRRPNHL